MSTIESTHDILDMNNYRVEKLKKSKKTGFEKWMEIVGGPLAIIVFLGIYYFMDISFLNDIDPGLLGKESLKRFNDLGSHSFSRINYAMLAIFAASIVLWITEAIPNYVSNKLNGEIGLGYSSTNRELLGSTDIHYGKNNFGFHLNYFNRKSDEYSDGYGTNVFNSDQRTHGYQLGASFIPTFGIVGVSYSDYANKYGIPSLRETAANPDEEGPIIIDMQKKDMRILLESTKLNSFINGFSFKGGYQDYKHKEIARTTGEVGTAFALKSISGDLSFKHYIIDSLFQGVFGFWGMQQKYSVNGEEASA